MAETTTQTERKRQMITETLYGPGGEPIPNVADTELLRTAMNALHQQPDAGLMPVEFAVIDDICDSVKAQMRDNNDTGAQAWHRAAVATKQFIRDHSESVKSEWIAAYAGLPPMERPHQ
jgi:hypothetical protein